MARRTRTILLLLVGVAVLVASVLPPGLLGDAGAALLGVSALFHLLGYAALAALVRSRYGPGRHATVLAVAVAAGFGLGIELLQTTVAGRGFSLRDVGVNLAGATVGAVVGARWPN
jgi:uncharacterized protein YfiM (DUF2279 family)